MQIRVWIFGILAFDLSISFNKCDFLAVLQCKCEVILHHFQYCASHWIEDCVESYGSNVIAALSEATKRSKHFSSMLVR